MWVVVLGSHLPYHSSACWGPFAEQAQAVRFAEFITAEVDPAQAIRVMNPTDEVLSWRSQFAQRTTTEATP